MCSDFLKCLQLMTNKLCTEIQFTGMSPKVFNHSFCKTKKRYSTSSNYLDTENILKNNAQGQTMENFIQLLANTTIVNFLF